MVNDIIVNYIIVGSALGVTASFVVFFNGWIAGQIVAFFKAISK